MKQLFSLLFLIQIICLVFIACDQSFKYEKYDSLKTSADLTLTNKNHLHGFGQKECFFCHVKSNIHQYDVFQNGMVDQAKEDIEKSGIESCYKCHGYNGVSQ